ncbi:MAG: hypothetical protein R3257_01240 [bacterium]|nr:hypothetical protein [bacterium]
MTPPKAKPVDISALSDLHLEIYKNSFKPGDYEVNPRAAALADHLGTQLSGSDLQYDPREMSFYKVVNGETHKVDIYKEANFVQALRDSDTSGDQKIDLEEVKTMMARHLPEDQVGHYDPKSFLRDIEALMEIRYRPIAGNMSTFSADLKWMPTMRAIVAYNRGLLAEDVRQSQAFLHPNNILKSAGNLVGFPFTTAYNAEQKGLSLFTEVKDSDYVPFLIADEVSFHLAEKHYHERDLAVYHFFRALETASKGNYEWYQNQDINGALEYMKTEMGEEFAASAVVLEERLPLAALHNILIQDDTQKVGQDLLEFAKAERPSYQFNLWPFFAFAFGGGNQRRNVFDSAEHFTRLGGGRNNQYFANSTLQMLKEKAFSPDMEANEALRAQADEVQSDMKGNGGGFANQLICPFISGHECRDWGDKELYDGTGHMMNSLYWFTLGWPKVSGAFHDVRATKHFWSPHSMMELGSRWLLRSVFPVRSSRSMSLGQKFGNLPHPTRGMGHLQTQADIGRFNFAKSWGLGASKPPLNQGAVGEMAEAIESITNGAQATLKQRGEWMTAGKIKVQAMEGKISVAEMDALEEAGRHANLLSEGKYFAEDVRMIAEHGEGLAKKFRQLVEAGKVTQKPVTWEELAKLLAKEGRLTSEEWIVLGRMEEQLGQPVLAHYRGSLSEVTQAFAKSSPDKTMTWKQLKETIVKGGKLEQKQLDSLGRYLLVSKSEARSVQEWARIIDEPANWARSLEGAPWRQLKAIGDRISRWLFQVQEAVPGAETAVKVGDKFARKPLQHLERSFFPWMEGAQNNFFMKRIVGPLFGIRFTSLTMGPDTKAHTNALGEEILADEQVAPAEAVGTDLLPLLVYQKQIATAGHGNINALKVFDRDRKEHGMDLRPLPDPNRPDPFFEAKPAEEEEAEG